jgi:pimeloyl-ACP methyl ester carboxylesterase
MNTASSPEKPNKTAFLLELMAIKDFASLMHPRATRILPEYTKTPKHVVLLPAYGADKRYFKPLAKYLELHGHKVYDWGLGLNDAGIKRNFTQADVSDSWLRDKAGKAAPPSKDEMGISYLCTRTVERINALYNIIQLPIVVIGWSLGGIVAREAARELPTQISQVITLGTPCVGGSKYTAAADSFRKNDIDLDWVEQQLSKREETPIEQAITIINGKYDGVIAKSACLDYKSSHTQVLEHNCSHMGLIYHYRVWHDVLKALSVN